MPKTRTLALAAVVALAATACGAGGGEDAADIGGEINMARPDWESSWMSAAIYQQLLEELGYEVADPAAATRNPNGFYPALARGEFDLWSDGWFPGHDIFLERTTFTGYQSEQPIEPVGRQVRAGALQGYLVDKRTADELDLTSMSDFTRPEVAEAFDTDGDGLANLAGCDEGWGCNPLIEQHIEELDWGAHVEQDVGNYWSNFDDVQNRVANGDPALFYAWTPNWTVEALEPGSDVVWLESPELAEEESETGVEGLTGCAGDADPCQLGFVPNDIRAVANTEFLEENPAVRRLLEVVRIPLVDIQNQNTRMARASDYTEEEIQADAAAWIEANRELVDEWLATARAG